MIQIMYTFSIKGKTTSIFPSFEANAPIIYLNTFSNEGQKVYEATQAANCPLFTLVAISDLDWNHDMAPWDSPAAFKKGEPFRAVPVKQEKIKSPDFRGEYGVTSVTPFLFASISLAE